MIVAFDGTDISPWSDNCYLYNSYLF